MSRHFKVDDVLREVDRPACERLALWRSTTVDQLRGWLTERGYEVSRSAAHNWLRHFRTIGPDRHVRTALHQRIETLDREQLAATSQFLSTV